MTLSLLPLQCSKVKVLHQSIIYDDYRFFRGNPVNVEFVSGEITKTLLSLE